MNIRSKENIMIMVVEDDETVQVALKYILHAQAYEVVFFERVDKAWEWLLHNTPNVVILDVNLPDDSGFNLARKIRLNFECGILILSDRTSTNDILHGLELGADHYITKPFLPRDLLLRVNNLILRNKQLNLTNKDISEEVTIGDWAFSFSKKRLKKDNEECQYLTKLETDLLQIFTSFPEQLFDREALIEKLHGGLKRPTDRTIDLLVMGLRRKLGEPGRNPNHIITVSGQGYYFQF